MQLLLFIVAYPIIWLISILPFRLLYMFSDFVCFLVYNIFGYRKKVVRENIAMAKYVFTDFREGSKFGSRLLWLNQALRIVMAYPFMLFMFFFIAIHPLLFLSSTLLGILIVSSFPVLFYAKRYNLSDSLWAYSYSVFYTFSLFWITPYAIVTANKRGWLTRGLV